MDAEVRTSVANSGACVARSADRGRDERAFGMGGSIEERHSRRDPRTTSGVDRVVLPGGGSAPRDGGRGARPPSLLRRGHRASPSSLPSWVPRRGTRRSRLSKRRAQWALFRELLRYLDARTCRHDFVLRYFGDEHEVLGGCGHCDVCAAIDEGAQESDAVGDAATLVVRKALSGGRSRAAPSRLQAVADMLPWRLTASARGALVSPNSRRSAFFPSCDRKLDRRDPARVLVAAGWGRSHAQRTPGCRSSTRIGADDARARHPRGSSCQSRKRA